MTRRSFPTGGVSHEAAPHVADVETAFSRVPPVRWTMVANRVWWRDRGGGQERPEGANLPSITEKRNVLESQDVKDPALRDPHLGDDGQGEEREVHEGVLDRPEPPGMLFESA